MTYHRWGAAALAAVAASAACGGASDRPGATALFDLDVDPATPQTFFSLPFPSNLRVNAIGGPDLRGFPNPKAIPIVADLVAAAADNRGMPAMPVVYFPFDGPLAPRVETDPIPADPDADILIVDLDDVTLVPAVARTLAIDDYLPHPTLAVAPYPGFVLRAGHTYAVVVRRDAGDAAGERLGVPPAFGALARGRTPDAARGVDAVAAFAPLWPALDALGVPADEVAIATVFTVGDVVADVAALSDALLARYATSVAGIALDPEDGADHDRYCELVATVELPQFQQGEPPFDDGGLFEIGADGLPVLQRTETVPLVLAIPKTPMPAQGYPLMLYFHGSGGVARTVVDRGPRPAPGEPPAAGLGPAHVVAEHGIASAGAALPLSPDRVPGAGSYDYLNFNNLAMFRDTFRQGMIEQRLLLRALVDLAIDPGTLAGCTGPTLPAGATAFRFDPDAIVASGQSMGGMYANLVSAVEPRIRAVVPTGAGGYWSYMILDTDLIGGTRDLLSVLLGTPYDELTFLHPGMHLIELAWEPAEPFVYMPRLARRPLPGHPVRPVYEPVGMDDEFFRRAVYDAAAIAYGHRQAGTAYWSSMQPGLALAGLDGIEPYPVADDVAADDGTPYTGVVVQYPDDGIDDAHYIYAQRDDVKYQYACFFASFLRDGRATVPAPAAPGTPCP
ncbi:MAG: hypothetical protein D6689_07510 [Deltaproteobacteria bacterium]|nr:MAG: hypothetical protein D6689_07510 [Deltaproteobacteria bacterium]